MLNLFYISKRSSRYTLLLLSVLILLQLAIDISAIRQKERIKFRKTKQRSLDRRPSTFALALTKKICVNMDSTLRARHKSCFLRPDTGPCRADLIQWYYDVKQRRCYRFFWGGCQGNGNRFETKQECLNHCLLNTTHVEGRVPYFCSLAFDYGQCFGHYNRYTWDRFTKSCRRRIYSGCGGNQNNFETQQECMETCRTPPNNTLQRFLQFTTCIPIHIPELF